jgi:predicted metalloprotease with PDZ domain
VGDGYGGLEHRASCSLLCSRNDLPVKGVEEVSEKYRSFLGLCSHEYFHTWNIKRIKPAVFIPYELDKETHTRTLWAFEGITSYYDDLSLTRTGLIPHEGYLDLLAKTITRVLRGSGRFKQTVTESSFDAWTKFYKQDENAPNAIVSYYTKGSLIALALDLTIRLETDGKRSLDDVMVALWNRYGKQIKGVGEQDIERIAKEVSRIPLDHFFERALHSTEDIVLDNLFSKMGIDYIVREANNDTDTGGVLNGESTSNGGKRKIPVLGVRTAKDSAGIRLTHVLSGGAAELAGLSAGDVVMAIDGIWQKDKSLADRFSQYQAGESVQLHAFRRDELMTFDVTLQEAPKDTCELRMTEHADKEMINHRNQWLNGE